MNNELFSLYWTQADGQQIKEKYLTTFEECKTAFDRLTQGPAGQMGMVKSVKLIDSLDCLIVELTRKQDRWVRTF